MRAVFALGAILGITLRHAQRLRRALTADPADQHDRSWCACDCGDDPAPCPSSISFGGPKTCTLTRGHDGLHEHGGWRWTDGIAGAAA